MRRVLAIARKEFRQLGRDRRTLGILIGLPAFMLLMFGYAVDFDVRNIGMAVYDGDGSTESRAVVRTFVQSGYFTIVRHVNRADEIDDLLDREVIRLGLVIPKGFADDITMGTNPGIQVLIDGANASAAATVAGYANAVLQDFSIRLISRTPDSEAAGVPMLPVELHPRVWYNPELRSPKFLVPGLIAFILMVTSVVSTALSVVREKERGTMEQITVAPVHPYELIIGKTIPYIITSLAATIMILFVGNIFFDVSIEGNYFLLFLVVLLFLFGSLGWGLLISTIAETQQVAFMIALTTTMLPTFILSGFVFPIHNMPAVIQAITYIVPAKYFLVALRGIMLKGTGLAAYWEQLVFLAGFAAIVLSVSSVRMKKRS